MDQLGEASVLAGRFRLLELVGAGDSGGVWRAIDQVAGGEVAVKTLPAYPVQDAAARDRFGLVARALLRLSGPGIASVRDFGEAVQPGGLVIPYLVRELVTGQTLDQRLEEAPLAGGQALRVVAAAAAALAAAHQAGLPHGHMVPANVVLGPGQATVTDFGLSALRPPAAAHTFWGGLSYTAPELAGGGAATPAADMYALGAIFAASLAGISSRARAYAELETGFGDPSAEEPEAVPASLAALWAACLGLDPVQRPTAAQAALMSRQILHIATLRGRAAPAGQSAPAGELAPAGQAVPAGRTPRAGRSAPGGRQAPPLRSPGRGRDRGLTGPQDPHGRRSRHGRMIALGGVLASTGAAVTVVVLVSWLGARWAAPVPPAAAARPPAAETVPSPPAAGRAPAPEGTSSVLAPAPVLSPRAVLGQLSATIRADVARGQIRPDVGVDFGNLIAPVQAELAAGRRAPVAELAATLRAKLRTRQGEDAVTAGAASILNGELDALDRSARS